MYRFEDWTLNERDGDLWITLPNGTNICLGEIDPACEKLAEFLAQRDFGES